jgi:hypothetical protein
MAKPKTAVIPATALPTSTPEQTSGTQVAQNDFKVEVDKAIVKGEFNIELTRQFNNYQNIINEANAVLFTPDNLAEAGEVLKTVRSVIAKIDKLREAKKAPYLENGKKIDAAAKELSTPLQEVLDRKTGEYRTVAEQVKKQQEEIRIENERVQGVQRLINDFILDASQRIAGSKTADEIVQVEKLIGSHKVNKSRYQEFLPDLVKRTDELLPLIKEQKESIRQLDELNKKKEEAEKSGDDAALLDVMERQELVESKIEEGKVLVQEAAVNQATSADVVVPEVVAPSMPNARRTSWKAELIDAKEAFKRSPELLEISLNASKISDSIKTLKNAGLFSGKTEVVIGGIRYYEEKLY